MSINEPHTIVLIDDHALVCRALTLMIDSEPGLRVIGEAGDAQTGVEIVRRLKPDLVLLDVVLPGMSAFSAAEMIRRVAPQTRVVFLSAYSNDYFIDEAIRVNAAGYIAKGCDVKSLFQGIREVAAGGVYFGQTIRARLSDDIAGRPPDLTAGSRAAQLTPREREVLRHLAQGLGLKEIARIMHLSVKTVDNHKSHLMAKLDIHDRVRLARFAIREGLIEA